MAKPQPRGGQVYTHTLSDQEGSEKYISLDDVESSENNAEMQVDNTTPATCFKCQGELPNDLQNIVGSSEAEQIIPQTPLKNIVGTKELEKDSNENKKQ